MPAPSEEQARLWTFIVTSGLEEEYERDWLGRIRSRSTKRYLKAELTPELAQALASASAQLNQAAGTAKAAITSGKDAMRKLLTARETNEPE
jgi:hypothetical protein